MIKLKHRKIVTILAALVLLVAGTAAADTLTQSTRTFTYTVAGTTVAIPAQTFTQTVSVPTVTQYVTTTVPSTTTTPTPANGWWDASTAQVDPSSGSLMQGFSTLNALFGGQSAWADASSADPTYTIPLTKQGGSLSVQIPLGTKPSTAGGDGHLAIRNVAAGTDTDLWQAVFDSTTGRIKSASAGVTFPIDSVNEHTGGWGGDAANLSLRPFEVTPAEMAAGVIDHPLAFGMPNPGPGFRYPALHGAGTVSGHPSEGTWFRLDPSVDVDALAIPAYEKTIAHALQRYGAFLEDGAGALAFAAQDPVNQGGWSQWLNEGFTTHSDPTAVFYFSSAFPWGRLQVLDPPPVR